MLHLATQKKELFFLLAQKEIYLPLFQLDKAFEILREQTKIIGPFKAIDALVDSEEFKQYNDIKKGAYVIYKQKKEGAKAIVQSSKSGEKVNEYESIYAAAIALGKGSQGAGHISLCLNGKSKSAYGYVWKFKNIK